jgi:hypothetical protein
MIPAVCAADSGTAGMPSTGCSATVAVGLKTGCHIFPEKSVKTFKIYLEITANYWWLVQMLQQPAHQDRPDVGFFSPSLCVTCLTMTG